MTPSGDRLFDGFAVLHDNDFFDPSKVDHRACRYGEGHAAIIRHDLGAGKRTGTQCPIGILDLGFHHEHTILRCDGRTQPRNTPGIDIWIALSRDPDSLPDADVGDLTLRHFSAQAQRVHADNGGHRGPGSEIFPNAGPLLLDGPIEWGVYRDVSQLLAGDLEFRATLDEDSPAVVDLFASVFEAAEGDLIRGLRGVDLRTRSNTLLEERRQSVAVGTRFLCQHTCLFDQTRLFLIDVIVGPGGR